jgi:dolichol-phosphate mannosyltransferase
LDRHAIIIPTYNERENIGLLVQNILDLGIGSQVIIVDDHSPDGTGQLADELAGQHRGVRVIHRAGNSVFGVEEGLKSSHS